MQSLIPAVQERTEKLKLDTQVPLVNLRFFRPVLNTIGIPNYKVSKATYAVLEEMLEGRSKGGGYGEADPKQVVFYQEQLEKLDLDDYELLYLLESVFANQYYTADFEAWIVARPKSIFLSIPLLTNLIMREATIPEEFIVVGMSDIFDDPRINVWFRTACLFFNKPDLYSYVTGTPLKYTAKDSLQIIQYFLPSHTTRTMAFLRSKRVSIKPEWIFTHPIEGTCHHVTLRLSPTQHVTLSISAIPLILPAKQATKLLQSLEEVSLEAVLLGKHPDKYALAAKQLFINWGSQHPTLSVCIEKLQSELSMLSVAEREAAIQEGFSKVASKLGHHGLIDIVTIVDTCNIFEISTSCIVDSLLKNSNPFELTARPVLIAYKSRFTQFHRLQNGLVLTDMCVWNLPVFKQILQDNPSKVISGVFVSMLTRKNTGDILRYIPETFIKDTLSDPELLELLPPEEHAALIGLQAVLAAKSK